MIELKNLLEKMWELFSCNTETLTTALTRTVMSCDKRIYEGYLTIVDGDLSIDYLQKIFQYHMADRKEKCQDFTPESIARLTARLSGDGETVYDCCAGSGALTIAKWNTKKDSLFICEELDSSVIPYLLFNLCVRNISGFVIQKNTLTQEILCVFEINNGERFSSISIVDSKPEFTANSIVSNPPYNLPWSPPPPLLADQRFEVFGTPPENNANLAFVLSGLNRLSECGRACFILPNVVLTKSDESEIRKQLVKLGKIESVILLPERMFESTSIPVCIITLSNGNEAVTFYNCRERFDIEEREQRGQFGGSSHETRVYKKRVSVLSGDLIDRISGQYTGDEIGFCKKVTFEEIEQNEWNLSPSRYVGIEETQDKSRDIGEIIDDINRIARERNLVKITVNETISKELGLYEVAEILKSEKDINETNERTFKMFGRSAIKNDYLTLTKNKNELKIENKDKEIMSSLMLFFLPMWKQHVFYLNQEENRLLAELRDALLPKLMKGEIQIEGENT